MNDTTITIDATTPATVAEGVVKAMEALRDCSGAEVTALAVLLAAAIACDAKQNGKASTLASTLSLVLESDTSFRESGVAKTMRGVLAAVANCDDQNGGATRPVLKAA